MFDRPGNSKVTIFTISVYSITTFTTHLIFFRFWFDVKKFELNQAHPWALKKEFKFNLNFPSFISSSCSFQVYFGFYNDRKILHFFVLNKTDFGLRGKILRLNHWHFNSSFPDIIQWKNFCLNMPKLVLNPL